MNEALSRFVPVTSRQSEAQGEVSESFMQFKMFEDYIKSAVSEDRNKHSQPADRRGREGKRQTILFSRSAECTSSGCGGFRKGNPLMTSDVDVLHPSLPFDDL